jgi:hypothetical protein
VILDFGARAQDFLKRITPLSADLAAHGRTRHPRPPETSQNLPSRSPHPQSPLHPGHRQTRPLQVPRARSRAVDPDHLVLRPRKMRSGQRFSYLALELRRKPHAQRRLPRVHSPRPIQSHPARVPKPSSKTALELLASDRYLQKGMGLMALTGAGLPRSSLAPPSASLEKNSPIPLSSSTASSKPAKLPVPVSSRTSSPSSPTPRNLSRPSTLSDR